MQTVLSNISDSDSRTSLKLASAVRRLINSRHLKTGDPLPSERELTSQFGVSRTLVRAAFADLERQGLIEGGQGRVRRVSNPAGPDEPAGLPLVAVLNRFSQLRPSAGSQTGWDEHVAYVACQALQTVGKSALLVNPDSLRPDAPRAGLPAQTVGVLVSPEVGARAATTESLTAALAGLEVPVVVAGNNANFSAFHRVHSDHVAGAAMLTHWLLERGDRRILRLWRFRSQPRWLSDRDTGHEQAMREAGLEPLEPLRTADLAADRPDAENFEVISRTLAGYLMAWRSQHPEGFDALMVATDRHAYEAAAACRIVGLEPGRDVRIVGYDDSWADAPERQFEASPPAATINKQNPLIGRRMVEMLHERLDRTDADADDPVTVDCLAPRLVKPAAG